MSRYQDDYDYDENSEARHNLWQANLRRSIASKRGQKVLRDLRDALVALPGKRLIEGALSTVGVVGRVTEQDRRSPYPHKGRIDDARRKVERDGGEGVCAIGALLWWRNVKSGMSEAEAFEALPMLLDFDEEGGIDLTALEAQRKGVAYTLAWSLAYENDETWSSKSPEERYAACLAWVKSRIVEESSA